MLFRSTPTAAGQAVAAAVPTASHAPATDTVKVMRSVMVTMRDGIQLATDIYLPITSDPTQRFPVILERTPYGKTQPSRSERTLNDPQPMSRASIAEFFAHHGYAVVYQDCRGRYESEGVFVKYTSDGEDGYDTCAWIIEQPWSNGRIGTKGLSYAAHTQAALGSTSAPGVVAMFLDSGGFSNAYQGGIRQGGAFELKQVTWAIKRAMESPGILGDKAKYDALASLDIEAWFRRVEQWQPGASPLSLAPEYEDYLFDQWQRGSFDDYWRQPGLYAEGYYGQFPTAATVHMSSWYDPYSRTACTNYAGLIAAGKGPACLILGPWTHGNRSQTYAGDVDFGVAATLDNNLAPDFLALRLQWFDRYLKHKPAGNDEAMPGVCIFVMGGGSGRKNSEGRMEHGGHWRVESEWPLQRTRETAYYLHQDGSLSTSTPQQEQAQLSYDYDPQWPVPTIGGAVTSGEPLMVGGAYDQRCGPGIFFCDASRAPLRERDDILVFQSAPLSADVEITGAISAALWISSDCVDTDFTIKLIDVYPPNADYPDGYEMILTDGIRRARYRNSWEQPEMMEPGTIYQVTVDAFPVSNVFKTGHRIRIDISSSNFPKFDCNPNTGAAEGVSGPVKVARNVVFCDSLRSSHVVLPVIPA
ncbi:CocE/NonD family hydrolase [Undibacterium sp. CY18W]|uniref:CocE/NonD family hydrolase n=1 Tax=Undibacterium hunanense TaxID=2762292 RepID=A0ABR6ZJ26_9BURK|nr:CocE/NonD family hydrolase [Undibacterium hunanense]MBC3915882.1 CocE/NonD family hydrolase [Undibacterium hunanense]